MSETLVLDFELNCPIGRVWHALTDSATLSAWTFFETGDFRPVVGHKSTLRGKPGSGGVTVDGEVLEVDEPHRLSYTWVVEAYRHQTKVTWTLAEGERGITRLHLEQSGFASDAKQAIGGAKYGWTHMVDQLRNRLESQ